MEVKHLHKWNLSYADARNLQDALASRVEFRAISTPVSTVAGLDCAFSRDKKTILAAIVVLRYPTMEILETVRAAGPVDFPYIPGLLSFREAPICLEAAEKLKSAPDLFLVDGQGIAHPRRMGIAAHLGLFLDRPTVGCAKSRLTGEYEEPGPDKGDHSLLRDKEGEVIGAVVRTRTRVKPLFVSVGHKCLLEDAVRFTLACALRYRLPEPTRQAHLKVTAMKKEYS